MKVSDRFFTLNNGVRIPDIGFGTYKSVSDGDGSVIRDAVAQGYRLFDTASFYGNEEIIGRALAESGIPREDFFLTTKVWKTEMGYDNVFRACDDSLERLGTDYIDLYLIHWPRPDLYDSGWRTLDIETWRAMEELYHAGKVRAIGVCNFLPRHLKNLLSGAHVVPAVDQIEFHPGYTQDETVEFCWENGILVEGWSPAGRGRLLDHPLLVSLAEKYGVSVVQLCIRFALQKSVLPLPKASRPEHMTENRDVSGFTISAEDMALIGRMPVAGWSGEHPDRERIPV